jgi:hypothetical protein
MERKTDVFLGNAKIDGLEDDLPLGGNRFNVALTCFYILYVLLDIPSNWLLKVVGGGRYLPILAMVSIIQDSRSVVRCNALEFASSMKC